MTVIFLFSTDLFGASTTFSITRIVLRWLFPFLPEPAIATIHVGLRKVGHVGSYAALSYFYLCGLLKTFHPLPLWQTKWGVLAFVLCILYACTDEWHQSFSTVRTGSVWDVGWDTLGAAITQTVNRIRSKNS